MKPKGKWKYADRIGLISLGYFNEPQNNFRDWTFKFFDKQRKKSLYYMTITNFEIYQGL